jgi:D-glycero-D-manno-heptose 1,7-bisphosphate phosphatase
MGVRKIMNRAVFLDRDGVINKLVYNVRTKEFESPHFVKDLKLIPDIIRQLKKLKSMGYLLFIISNQPSYAKGKTSLKNIKAIHEKLHNRFVREGIEFTEYYYCYHHPEGIVRDYSGKCECRKPSPYFLLSAKEKYMIDMENSWFIGDQDIDVFCGQAGNVRTILIENAHSKKKSGKSSPDFQVHSMKEAVMIISKNL